MAHAEAHPVPSHQKKEGSHAGCCGGESKGRIFIPKDQQTAKERFLQEQTAAWKIEAELPSLLQFLADRFFSVKSKGDRSGWNAEVEQYILKEIMKEGVQFYYEKKLKTHLSLEAKSSATEHLLVANPSQWKNMFEDIELNAFSEQHMKALLADTSVVIRKFILGEAIAKVKEELTHLERDSKFERGYANNKLTNEKFMNFSLGMVTKKDFPGYI